MGLGWMVIKVLIRGGEGYVVLDVDCEVRFARPVEEMEHDDAARRRWRRMDFIENR